MDLACFPHGEFLPRAASQGRSKDIVLFLNLAPLGVSEIRLSKDCAIICIFRLLLLLRRIVASCLLECNEVRSVWVSTVLQPATQWLQMLDIVRLQEDCVSVMAHSGTVFSFGSDLQLPNILSFVQVSPLPALRGSSREQS